ncbi:glycosyltransferase family 4 protein [Bifidobacterium avesanii]|uniref:Glycosyltransferase n=1 Tax=Bifidobacterium avesanii TaxID=1798157 RepID=A0A7K3TKE8_9BIFI|nr:glycosyltransferase family 4 protein [Bifidobacterium avesanii]KAB8288231.1 Glycosyl transferases group 1 [Bifidobacterium avesanii]NEG78733.1 glycosyltransferase [Bifidobacterium avesanii]
MNILNVVYSFQPGGVERLAIDVSNALVDTGNHAYLCIISEDYSEALLNQLNPEVKLFKLKKNKRNHKLGYIEQLISIIDHEHIDVVHVHQGNLMPFYAVIKLLRPHIRLYFTSHDTHIFSELNQTNQLLARLLCKKIIAISDAVVADIQACGVSQRKIVRIYNGTNFSRFSVQENHSTHESVPHIVNVARFFPAKKGQDLLIKAAAILKVQGRMFHITFAGGETADAPHAIADMQRLAKSSGVEDRIDFLGNVTDVPSLLRQSDVFCLPSRYEGFGISAVEAMGMGLPCVVSDVEGLNEVINDPRLGELFSAGDAADLAYKLDSVLDQLDTYDPTFISGDAKARFSIEHMVDRLLTIYREGM